MKGISLLTFSAFLNVALANPDWAHNPPTLDANAPIYLASVFHPPEMHFFVTAPPSDRSLLHDQKRDHWCREGEDVTESVSQGARTQPFTFKGMDGLKVHDYYTDQAYISRYGIRFADCFVGPASIELGFCPGRQIDTDYKLKGVGHRMWSCYVIKNVTRGHVFEPDVKEAEFVTREAVAQEENVVPTTARTGGEERKAFTAAVTGAA